MRRLAVVSLALLAAPAFAGPPQAPIIGGTPATAGEFPNVVAIEVGGGLCTGTLITPDWVLTAAHCLTPSVVGLPNQGAVTSSVKVHFGTLNVFSQPGTVVTAQETFPDPMFNVNALGSHDSGLIHLSSPVTNVTPVLLNLVAANAPVGVMVTMVGYGATEVNAMGNVGVEYVVQQTSESCSKLNESGLPTLSDSNLLCFDQSGNKGKCEGDSGGPSFAMIDGQAVEVGITSFGDNACAAFGADTRVDAEAPFITQHVPQLYCNADADCASGRICFAHTCITQPFMPGGLGATCMTGADCDSGHCAADGNDLKCSMNCMPGQADACPSGLDCLSTGSDSGTCWPSKSGGCDAAGGAAGGLALIALGLLGLTRRRS